MKIRKEHSSPFSHSFPASANSKLSNYFGGNHVSQMMQVQGEKDNCVVLFYKIVMQPLQTVALMGQMLCDKEISNDFKESVVQPPFHFPVYSVSSKRSFALNHNKNGITGVKRKSASKMLRKRISANSDDSRCTCRHACSSMEMLIFTSTPVH